MDGDLTYQLLLSAVEGRGLASDYYGLGCWLHDRKRWGAAAGCFAQAVALEPENHRALTNLGWELHLDSRHVEAADVLERAVQLAPEEGTPHALLSQVYCTLGGRSWAVEQAELGVRHDPGPPINHVALSFALMMDGQWGRGWQEYEHRFQYKIPEFATRPFVLWRGEQVKHLYLEAEQGSGDTIFALRWLGAACARVDRVTLYVHAPLYALIDSVRDLPANLLVKPMPQALPVDVDAWSPLMSLPAALGVEDIEPSGPYIRGYEQHKRGDKFNVGIVWAGNPTHEQAHHRDAHLAYFLRLSEIPGVRVHSLQVGDAAKQIQELAAFGVVKDRGPEITNFLDTAKLIGEMDLVVSVDTAVGHLAGAMGCPVFLLVNQRGLDFRWSYDRVTTEFYPSMVLYRRALGEEWSAVLERIDGEIRRRLGS